jgi:hypothetical protein
MPTISLSPVIAPHFARLRVFASKLWAGTIVGEAARVLADADKIRIILSTEKSSGRLCSGLF